jgi:hypothetical protein
MIPIDFGAEWTTFEEKWMKIGAAPNINCIFHLHLHIKVTYIPRITLSQNMTKTEEASFQHSLYLQCGIYHTVNLRDAKHTNI